MHEKFSKTPESSDTRLDLIILGTGMSAEESMFPKCFIWVLFVPQVSDFVGSTWTSFLNINSCWRTNAIMRLTCRGDWHLSALHRLEPNDCIMREIMFADNWQKFVYLDVKFFIRRFQVYKHLSSNSQLVFLLTLRMWQGIKAGFTTSTGQIASSAFQNSWFLSSTTLRSLFL